jgi:hypothetical protein
MAAAFFSSEPSPRQSPKSEKRCQAAGQDADHQALLDSYTIQNKRSECEDQQTSDYQATHCQPREKGDLECFRYFPLEQE